MNSPYESPIVPLEIADEIDADTKEQIFTENSYRETHCRQFSEFTESDYSDLENAFFAGFNRN